VLLVPAQILDDMTWKDDAQIIHLYPDKSKINKHPHVVVAGIPGMDSGLYPNR